MPNQVRVGVGVGGARQAGSELDKFRDKFTGLQKASAKGLIIGAGVAATNFALGALKGAFQGISDVVGEATQAFIEDEASQAKLRTSLRANIDAWDGNLDAIEGVIAARIKLGFTDDEQRTSLAGLAAAYGNVTKALEVQREAMDLARFSGVDLATATEVLIKVHAGSFRALKALGINTKDITTETAALAAIQKIAAGQAEDFAQTLEGRLAVAAARTQESMEHLGQATAEFSADFETAKAGALENFVVGLDATTDALNYNNQTLDRQAELQKLLLGLNPLLTDEQKQFASAAIDAQTAAAKQADAMLDLDAATGRYKGTAATARTTTSALADRLGFLRGNADDAAKAIDGLTTSVEEGLFGKAITAGHEAQLKDNIKDLERQREAAHKGSLKWLELTGEIAQNRQELFDLHLEQAATAGPQAAIEFLKKQKRLAGDASGKLQELIDKYEALAALKDLEIRLSVDERGGRGLTPQGNPGAPPRQHGGPVSAHEAYTVGEGGKAETLVMGDRSGYVVPGVPSSGLTVIIQAPNLIATPADAQRMAQAIGPHIATYLSRRRLLSVVA